MKTIIAGSRTITDYGMLLYAIEDAPWNITAVVSGAAKGADKLGEKWASEHQVPLSKYLANWRPGGVFNPRAGLERNDMMAKRADALIALWDGLSPGTAHMIRSAKRSGLLVYVLEEDRWERLRARS
jgi:hypothetical protein